MSCIFLLGSDLGDTSADVDASDADGSTLLKMGGFITPT